MRYLPPHQLFEFQPFAGILDTEMDVGVVDIRPARNIAKLTQIIGKFEYLHRVDVLDAGEYKGKRRINQNTEMLFNLYLRLLFDGGITEYEDDSEYAPSGCVSFLTISLYIGYADRTMPYTGACRKLDNYTDSYRKISEVIDSIYTSTTKVGYPIRRVCISFNDLSYDAMMNLSFFSDPVQEEREHKMQKAVASIKNRFGKNSVLRCMSLQEKATAQIRNKLVGGHNSGEN